jgi:hypothetical protein
MDGGQVDVSEKANTSRLGLGNDLQLNLRAKEDLLEERKGKSVRARDGESAKQRKSERVTSITSVLMLPRR